jgi:glycosyltransferase involved in cell wall biosynthesis
MDNSEIALLIPCYNVAARLPNLLRMALNQTVPFAEIICYDDCSQDATAEIASAAGARVIRGKENRGAAYARNRLLENASAKFVHFHDAGDELAPDYNAKILPFLRDDTAVVCAVRQCWESLPAKKNCGDLSI